MVLINTQINQLPDIEFKHIVEIQRCDCIFGTAREKNGRTHLYLIFNHKGRIYRRNGLKSTWVELTSTAEYNHVRDILSSALKNRTVPVYRTSSESNIN